MKEPYANVALGIAGGAAFGALLSIALDNTPIGVAICMALGGALGALASRRV
jgi:hypothetical protein